MTSELNFFFSYSHSECEQRPILTKIETICHDVDHRINVCVCYLYQNCLVIIYLEKTTT